jgi:hypothetical protein
MDAKLGLGETIPLQTPLQKGMVLAFKSQGLDLTLSDSEPTILELWNNENNVVLQVVIKRRRDEAVFNARTQLSLLDGWGKSEKITNIAKSRPSISRFTISVHDCGDKYQILFNLTTMHYFQKRFSINSTATKVTYRQELDGRHAKTLSQTLSVSVYNLNSLPPEEKLAVQTGK